MADTSHGFGFCEAVELLTAPIPQDNAALPVPDKDGLIGQIDQQGLLTQLLLHLFVRGDIVHHADQQNAIRNVHRTEAEIRAGIRCRPCGGRTMPPQEGGKCGGEIQPATYTASAAR